MWAQILEEEEENAKEQTPASPEEKAWREAEGRTQGRKGCEMPRVNLALRTPIYIYVRTMSKVTGRSMLAFVNDVLQERMDGDELYKKIQDVLKADEE
jgi:hypothetical protein